MAAPPPLPSPELFACFHNRLANRLTLVVRTGEFKSWLASHAVAQTLYLLAGDRHVAQVEEFDLRRCLAKPLCHDVHSRGALDLESVMPAVEGILARGGALVELQLHYVAVGVRVEADPVERRYASDQIEAVFSHRVRDDVADHMAVVAARHELLGPVEGGVLERVDAQARKQLHRVRPLYGQFGHVKREGEQDASFLPRLLLVAPV